MGLDIIAFSKMEKTEHKPEPNVWCEIEGHKQAYIIHPDFYLSLRGLEENYCYKPTEGTEDIEFRSGSYGGHVTRREMLWKMVNGPEITEENWEECKKLPFYELVFFADNEGTIGPLAALDLYGDFIAHKDAWADVVSNSTYPYPDVLTEWYSKWTRACELAADSGMIVFH